MEMRQDHHWHRVPCCDVRHFDGCCERDTLGEDHVVARDMILEPRRELSRVRTTDSDEEIIVTLIPVFGDLDQGFDPHVWCASPRHRGKILAEVQRHPLSPHTHRYRQHQYPEITRVVSRDEALRHVYGKDRLIPRQVERPLEPLADGARPHRGLTSKDIDTGALR